MPAETSSTADLAAASSLRDPGRECDASTHRMDEGKEDTMGGSRDGKCESNGREYDGRQRCSGRKHWRRRLVGRAYLPLSSFLDPEWMREERSRQRLGRGKEAGACLAEEGKDRYMCVVFALNRFFYPTTLAHPVSVPSFHPGGIQIMLSQTVRQSKTKINRN